MDNFKKIGEALAKCWEKIESIVLSIINFVENILEFFNKPKRIKKLKEDKDIIAVTIKEKLENGDYTVVICLFNKKTSEIVNPQEDAQIIHATSLDEETEKAFNGKDMVVIE